MLGDMFFLRIRRVADEYPRENMNSPTRGFGNEDGPLNFSEKQRRRCIYLQARVDPKSLILRGPQNGVVTVSTMESRKVAAMERLFYLSHQVYHSKVSAEVCITRILPVAAVLSLVAFVFRNATIRGERPKVVFDARLIRSWTILQPDLAIYVFQYPLVSLHSSPPSAFRPAVHRVPEDPPKTCMALFLSGW